MDTTLRHWHMLRALPRSPRKTDTRAVAGRLDSAGFPVSRRTVERDLQHLSTVFPIVCDDRERPYGWAWAVDSPPFDVPGMDIDTALSFAVLDRFARHLLPGHVIERLRPHIARAHGVLDQTADGSGPRTWTERIRILSRSFGLLAPSVEPEVTEAIYHCLLEGQRFRAMYRSRSGGGETPREFEVHPLGLVFRDQVAYLVVTLWDYDDIRQLALHRFDSAEATGEQCRVPPGFDLDAYIREGHFHIRESEADLAVRLRFDTGAAFHLAETPLAEDQRLHPPARGTVDVEATVRDTAQFRWWLLGFGEAVEVIEPESLRAEVAGMLQRSAARYADV